MNLKEVIRKIRDHNRNIQERLFRLMVLIGLVGLAAGIGVGVLSGENPVNLIPLAVLMLLFTGIVWLSLRFRKIQTGAIVIAALVLFLALPLNFLTSGGLYGGATIWFLFGFVFTTLVVEGKGKYILLVSGYLTAMGCYAVAYYFPSKIIQHTLEMAYVDSIVTLTIVSALTCGMILFQNAIYRSENAIAQKQKKEIEELNRSQNHFFSSMSHEIRTPINTIIGLNEMILREAVSEEVASDARSIQGASRMLLALINDILDMSKIESGKMDIVPVPYDVGSMLSDIVNMIWVRAREKKLEFHVDVDETIPARLCGDEIRIKQILINLLNNAVKYTQEGTITLSLRGRRTSDDLIAITYSVQDTGMGIKKENIPYLFSAFKRVDEARNRYIEGTGLGLSIVRQLVALMGGEVAVNSVYRKGSTFVVTLPQQIVSEEPLGELNLEARHALNARERYRQSFEAPRAHILIVDDDDMNRMVACKLLSATGVQIDTAAGGAECLKKTLQSRYDVIFMDHIMPEMDGIECLHRLRVQPAGLNQDIPVVILTANAGSENEARYRREGFDGYLLKPISGRQLEAELLRLLPQELVHLGGAEGFAGVVERPIFEHKKRQQLLITTDSLCDLPAHITERAQIAVIPCRVCTESGEFIDGIEAETAGVIAYMEKDHLARSMPPEVVDYEAFFADQLTRAQSLIHISIARNASSGYANALEASKSFDNVTVIDSGHLSSGMGIIALRAAECVRRGCRRRTCRKRSCA